MDRIERQRIVMVAQHPRAACRNAEGPRGGLASAGSNTTTSGPAPARPRDCSARPPGRSNPARPRRATPRENRYRRPPRSARSRPAARLCLLQLSRRSGQHRAPVARAHQGREMDRARQLADRLEQRARMGAAVDDAQHLRRYGKTRRDRLVRRTGSASTLDPHPPQRRVERRRVRRQFARSMSSRAGARSSETPSSCRRNAGCVAVHSTTEAP